MNRREEKNNRRAETLMGSLLRFEEEQAVTTDRIYVALGKHLSIL
jgi:hypothetical protein